MEERITSKHGLGLAQNVRREKFLALFWHFCASVAIASVYPSEIPTQLPGTLTHPLPIPPSAAASLSLTVTFPRLSLTSLCSLLWDLAFPRLPLVTYEISHASPLCGFRAKTDRRILCLVLTHTHAHTTNAHYRATIFTKEFSALAKKYVKIQIFVACI